MNNCRCMSCLRQLPPDGNPIPHDRRWMVVCDRCGNKRCPHAENHQYVCTESNAPNQEPRLAIDWSSAEPNSDLIHPV